MTKRIINDNNTLVKVLLSILIITISYLIIKNIYERLTDKTENITSDVDGKNYHVRNIGPPEQKKQTANQLATISKSVDSLTEYMLKNNLPTQQIAARLYDRWNKCKLRETSLNENSAAYTINKGDEMRICIRNNGNTLPINTSMFVILHELAHLMSISYGHNEEFKENFSYIVHLASALGYYKPQSFDSNPVDYCGTIINTTPCVSGTCQYTTIPTPPPAITVETFLGHYGF